VFYSNHNITDDKKIVVNVTHHDTIEVRQFICSHSLDLTGKPSPCTSVNWKA